MSRDGAIALHALHPGRQEGDCVSTTTTTKNYKFIYLFNCILRFGVHVKNMQDCCIGTHAAL